MKILNGAFSCHVSVLLHGCNREELFYNVGFLMLFRRAYGNYSVMTATSTADADISRHHVQTLWGRLALPRHTASQKSQA